MNITNGEERKNLVFILFFFEARAKATIKIKKGLINSTGWILKKNNLTIF
jgi:hypothetical protein